jgi:hypothetical protein
VDVADADTLPTGWKRNADFLITIVNQKDPKKNIAKGSSNISIGKSFMEDSTGQLSQRRVSSPIFSSLTTLNCRPRHPSHLTF